MEKVIMMKQQYSCADRSPEASSKLGMHKDSHLISKTTPSKPKVRIIHVFTPEIIKTDVANFRDLVQNLTGKPAVPTGLPEPNHKVKSSTRSAPPSKKMENSMQIISGERDRVKEEIQDYMMWRTGDHHLQQQQAIITRQMASWMASQIWMALLKSSVNFLAN